MFRRWISADTPHWTAFPLFRRQQGTFHCLGDSNCPSYTVSQICTDPAAYQNFIASSDRCGCPNPQPIIIAACGGSIPVSSSSPPSISPSTTAPAQSTSQPTSLSTLPLFTPPTSTLSTSLTSSNLTVSTLHSSSQSHSSNTTSTVGSQRSTSSFSRFTGGNILTGTCGTPEFTLLSGPQTTIVYYAPVLGCVGDKPDCCPFAVSTTVTASAAAAPTITATVPVTGTLTVTQTSDVTVIINTSSSGTAITQPPKAFPFPADQSQSALNLCPNDYITVSGGCCPSGYSLWTEALGGVTPCYSSPTTSLSITAPPMQASYQASSSGPSTTTYTVQNIIYARQYPLQPHAPALSKGAAIGVGVGSGVAAIAIVGLLSGLILSRRKNKRQRESQAASAALMASVSPTASTPYSVPASSVQQTQPSISYETHYHHYAGQPPPNPQIQDYPAQPAQQDYNLNSGHGAYPAPGQADVSELSSHTPAHELPPTEMGSNSLPGRAS